MDGLQNIGAQPPLYWSPFGSKNMFFVFFHGELRVLSAFGRPSSDTQNLVLSELSLFNPPQNIENKILGLHYIEARLQYIGAPLGKLSFTF